MHGMELLAFKKSPPKNNRVIGGIPATAITKSAKSYIKKILPRIKKFPRSYAALNADLIKTLEHREHLSDSQVLNKMKFLVRQGASVNHVTKETGLPPLSYARDVKEVAFLLENGAQKTINCSSRRGQTRLHDAALCHDLPMVKLLLTHRARADATDKQGATPLSELLNYRCGTVTNKEIQQQIAVALLENGASATINSSHKDFPTDAGVTPLFKAVFANNYEMTQLLLQHNAHLSINKKNGNTYLEEANDLSSPKLCHLLLYYGAQPTYDELALIKTELENVHTQQYQQEIATLPAIENVVLQFIPVTQLTTLVSAWLQPLSFDQTVQANQEAANRKVQEIQERLAAPISSNALKGGSLHAAPIDNVTRHSLDTEEEKHDENGNVVEPPKAIESLE
jgi:ankyrin repeat protein